MFSKGIAIIAITRRGVETALRIKETLAQQDLQSKVFAPEKYSQTGVTILDKKLDEFIKDTYQKVDAIIGVMASGIIIRAVAPCLQGKLVDPAVVGVDASGSFVVSLLSGHYGGANELTRVVAGGIGATPVITTASDVAGKQSIDELARRLHLKIENPESLVAVNSAIVNDGKVVIVKLGETEMPLTRIVGFDVKQAETGEDATDILDHYDAGVIIARIKLRKSKFAKPVAFLRPLTVAVGLGARKKVAAETIVDAVNSALAKANVPLERVDRLATVSIKKESRSMTNAAMKLGLKLEFLDVDVLREFKHDDLSPDSEIVKRNIGVGGVCERAALIAAGEKPRLILKKTKLDGVTVAVAEGE
jgi:cobalt-precorrin 5A hydrolase